MMSRLSLFELCVVLHLFGVFSNTIHFLLSGGGFFLMYGMLRWIDFKIFYVDLDITVV